MYSLNRAMILGNATRDPEMRYTPNGQAVANFGVATNRKWKTQTGDMQEKTEFHDVVAWGKLAEITNQVIKKGGRVYIEGRLQTRNWEAPDGTKRQRTEIIAENIISLTPRGEVGTPVPSGADESDNIDQTPPEEKTSTQAKTPQNDSKSNEKSSTEKNDNKEEAIDLNDIPF